MDKRLRSIFRISIGLNIILITLVVWGHLKMNYLKDQLFTTQVQYNFVELEELIEKQSNDHWTEPSLVTTQLGDLVKGIGLGIRTGETLSAEDKVTLHLLNKKLYQYPHDEKVNISDQDKKNFRELREILRDVRLGTTNTQNNDHIKTFMYRVTELEKRIGFLQHQTN